MVGAAAAVEVEVVVAVTGALEAAVEVIEGVFAALTGDGVVVTATLTGVTLGSCSAILDKLEFDRLMLGF